MIRIGLIAIVMLVMFAPLDAEAGRRHFNQRWDHREVIVVENRAGPEWNEGVEFVAREWHRLFPRLRFKVIHRPNKRCGVATGRIVICRWPFDANQSHGMAWNNNDKREITSANIRIARTGPDVVLDGFSLGAWNTHLSMWDVHSLCHEFGHAIGLEHYSFWRDSCMGQAVADWSLDDPNAYAIRPSAYDQGSLRRLYNRRGAGWP